MEHDLVLALLEEDLLALRVRREEANLFHLRRQPQAHLHRLGGDGHLAGYDRFARAFVFMIE